jgi:hypothetical protein
VQWVYCDGNLYTFIRLVRSHLENFPQIKRCHIHDVNEDETNRVVQECLEKQGQGVKIHERFSNVIIRMEIFLFMYELHAYGSKTCILQLSSLTTGSLKHRPAVADMHLLNRIVALGNKRH